MTSAPEVELPCNYLFCKVLEVHAADVADDCFVAHISSWNINSFFKDRMDAEEKVTVGWNDWAWHGHVGGDW